MTRSRLFAIVPFLFIIVPEVLMACPSCYGDPDSTMTQGLNSAIFLLLGITGTVLLGVAAFFVYLRHKTMVINRRFENMLN